MMEKGYVHVYTGDGKGKTTAAIGLCVRALGAGLRVYIGQFVKGMRYFEIEALEALAGRLGDGRLAVRQHGRGCLLIRSAEREDRDAAAAGLAEAREALLSGRFDLVVLDEIIIAVHLGLLEEPSILDLIDARPKSVELVLTGRYATPAVIATADLVTEMREVRHYYRRGVEARDGIER